MNKMGTQEINEAQTNDNEVVAQDLTKKQIFLYSLLIGITITIAIISLIGINLFVLKGLYKEIPMGTIYSGTIPFTLATVVAVALIFVAPPLATWLPSVLK